MSFRARLSLTALEARENPSGPSVIDPYGGEAPPPTEPATPPIDPVQLAIDAAIAGATATTNTTPPADPNDPLLTNNSVYNVPLVP